LKQALDYAEVMPISESLVHDTFKDIELAKQHYNLVSNSYDDKDPDTLTLGKNFEKLMTVTEKLHTVIEDSASATWNTLKSERGTSNLGHTILDNLKQIPSLTATITQIRRLEKEITGMLQPSTQEEFLQFEEFSKELANMEGSLEHESIPESVMTFFRQVQSTDGASVSLLTDEVLDWLEHNDMKQGIRIRFVNP